MIPNQSLGTEILWEEEVLLFFWIDAFIFNVFSMIHSKTFLLTKILGSFVVIRTRTRSSFVKKGTGFTWELPIWLGTKIPIPANSAQKEVVWRRSIFREKVRGSIFFKEALQDLEWALQDLKEGLWERFDSPNVEEFLEVQHASNRCELWKAYFYWVEKVCL